MSLNIQPRAVKLHTAYNLGNISSIGKTFSLTGEQHDVTVNFIIS